MHVIPNIETLIKVPSGLEHHGVDVVSKMVVVEMTVAQKFTASCRWTISATVAVLWAPKILTCSYTGFLPPLSTLSDTAGSDPTCTRLSHRPDSPVPSTTMGRLLPSTRLLLQKSWPKVPRVNSTRVAGGTAPTPLQWSWPEPQSPVRHEPKPDLSKLQLVRPQKPVGAWNERECVSRISRIRLRYCKCYYIN